MEPEIVPKKMRVRVYGKFKRDGISKSEFRRLRLLWIVILEVKEEDEKRASGGGEENLMIFCFIR